MGAGRLVYIKRNQQMIDHSQFCIFYIREDYMPKDRKSGTKIVFDYAQKYKKTIFKFPGCAQ